MSKKHFINNIVKNQYELYTKGFVAKVKYITASNKIFLTKTEVPDKLKDPNIISDIIKRTIEDLEMVGLQLVPVCPFVASYINKNIELERILDPGYKVA